MIHRFYADNFRCLSNFELELDEANVFLGVMGDAQLYHDDYTCQLQKISAHTCGYCTKYGAFQPK